MAHDTSGASADKVSGHGKVAGPGGEPVTESAMRSGGESGGEAREQPQTGDGGYDGFLGHGGQTEVGYHGSGQLGDRQTKPGNANAATKEE